MYIDLYKIIVCLRGTERFVDNLDATEDPRASAIVASVARQHAPRACQPR